MRILYVAKHGSGGSDDEGAIGYALEQLGHKVVRLPETMDNPTKTFNFVGGGDLVLFHKWDNSFRPPERKIPQVFWYFDLVQWYDPLLEVRCRQRVAWMNAAIKHVEIGFCTDGDWVAQDRTGKLVWLPQGADERVVGRAERPKDVPFSLKRRRILFTGISKGGGKGRVDFVDEMRKKYALAFTHLHRGCYRRDLAQMIATHDVLVCPDSPTTDKYWSNRVYNAAGFGACILHPWCGETLNSQYQDEKEIRYYQSHLHLHALIEHYTSEPKEAIKLGQAALERTKKEHLYRHRCEEMLRVVKERLGIG